MLYYSQIVFSVKLSVDNSFYGEKLESVVVKNQGMIDLLFNSIPHERRENASPSERLKRNIKRVNHCAYSDAISRCDHCWEILLVHFACERLVSFAYEALMSDIAATFFFLDSHKNYEIGE